MQLSLAVLILVINLGENRILISSIDTFRLLNNLPNLDFKPKIRTMVRFRTKSTRKTDIGVMFRHKSYTLSKKIG